MSHPRTSEHAETRVEEVRERLLAAIGSGRLQPGERLPAERTLARDLGVSRNVLREAVESLAARHLLEKRQGAGVFVAEFSASALVQPSELAILVGPASLRSIIQARLVIEPSVAALAAQTASGDEVDALHELARRSIEVIDDGEAFLDLDDRIHEAIVEMSRNRVLIGISESLRRLFRATRELGHTDPTLRQGAAEGHERVIRAIAARDPGAAASAMIEHLRFVESQLVDFAVRYELVGELWATEAETVGKT